MSNESFDNLSTKFVSSISLKAFNANIIAYTSMNTDIKEKKPKKNRQCLHLPLKVKLSLPHDHNSVILNHEGSSTMKKTASCSIPGREKEINFYITIVYSELPVKDKPLLYFKQYIVRDVGVSILF